MNTTKLLTKTIAGLAFMVVSSAQATVMDFDEFDSRQNEAYSRVLQFGSYKGFNAMQNDANGKLVRSNAMLIDKYRLGGSHYPKPTSGNQYLGGSAAWQESGGLYFVRVSGESFDFKGANFGSANLYSGFTGTIPVNPSSTSIVITGYDDKGRAIASTGTKALKWGSFTWMELGFKNIYSLGIKTNGINLYIDDFTYTASDSGNSTEVPIPAAAILFAPALLGFMGLRRKAKASA